MLTYVVNLDRDRDRLAAFMANNGHLSHLSRFPAVDGVTADTAELIRAGIIRPEILPRYSPADLGCALSHIALWEQAIADAKTITICEDDAIFNRHFEAASERAIALLPADWDLILWGWNFSGTLLFELLPGVSPCLSVFDESEMRQGVETFRAQSFPVSPFRLRQAFGTVCYSVSPKGARALREHCLPLRGGTVYCVALAREVPIFAIDLAMIEQYPKLQAFVGFPPLVLTRNERENSSTRGVDSKIRWDKPTMDPEIEQLARSLEGAYGCRAVLVETATLSERLEDGTAWEGAVHLFRLHGLPQRMQAYAWLVPGNGLERHFVSVLQSPEVNSPSVAVKAAIEATRKQ